MVLACTLKLQCYLSCFNEARDPCPTQADRMLNLGLQVCKLFPKQVFLDRHDGTHLFAQHLGGEGRSILSFGPAGLHRERRGVGSICQLIECVSHKHEDPISIPRTHTGKLSQAAYVCEPSIGGRKQQISGIRWLSRLA